MRYWTEDRETSLRQMWADGLSASLIADKLNDGVTRNAVLGKVHRLGLMARLDQGERSKRRVARHKKRAAFPFLSRPKLTERAKPQIVRKIELANTVIDPTKTVTFEHLDEGGARHCKWGYGDPRQPGFVFCGCERLPDKPYCISHDALAYQPPKQKAVAA
jgi:GcrA cell cycle regulator